MPWMLPEKRTVSPLNISSAESSETGTGKELLKFSNAETRVTEEKFASYVIA